MRARAARLRATASTAPTYIPYGGMWQDAPGRLRNGSCPVSMSLNITQSPMRLYSGWRKSRDGYARKKSVRSTRSHSPHSGAASSHQRVARHDRRDQAREHQRRADEMQRRHVAGRMLRQIKRVELAKRPERDRCIADSARASARVRLSRLQLREQDHVADRRAVGEQHHQRGRCRCPRPPSAAGRIRARGCSRRRSASPPRRRPPSPSPARRSARPGPRDRSARRIRWRSRGR